MGWALGWALGARESSPKGGQDILKLRHVDCGLTREMESTGQEAVVRKNRVRCCSQKPKEPFGVLRPEFIHVTMRYGAPRILLILKSDGVFGTHSSIVMQVKGEAPMMFTSSGETPAKPNRQKFVVFLVKDKGAPRWCRRTKSTFASIRCRKT